MTTAFHYFDQPAADPGDSQLGMAKMQGYVPQGCLLGGAIVMALVNEGNNPCWGCEGPRLNEGDVKRHTLARLDSFIINSAGKRLTYEGMIA